MIKRLIVFFIASSILVSAPQNYKKIVKLKETIEGEKLFAQGKYDEALVLFHDAIEKGEDRGEPHFYIGSVYELRRKYTESIPYFEEAVKRELPAEFREATLWKLILLHRKEENYSEVLTYIDKLEDMGITHSNLAKYREEAEVSLSPEKIEARAILKEGKKIIEDWEKENPEENFWSDDTASELRKDVLAKFEKAAAMDEKLVYLYWEIASMYEKSGDIENSLRIYDIIISSTGSDEAYYKKGVLLKKQGDYSKSREYFQQALALLKKENLKYFILINLSQVLYAMGEYADGLKSAEEAVLLQKDPDNIFSPGRLMTCLHLANLDNKSRGKKKCEYGASPSDLKNKDARAVTLYFFTAAETERSLFDLDKKDARLTRINDYYVRALIPPSLRKTSIKGIKITDKLSDYEDGNWSPLPEWALLHMSNLLTFWGESGESRNLYVFCLMYKKYIQSINPELYTKYFSSAAYNTGNIDAGIEFMKTIEDRLPNDEIMFLKMLLNKNDIMNFQNEVIEYGERNPDLMDYIKAQIEAEKMLDKVPREIWTDEFRSIWGDSGSINPQNEIHETDENKENSEAGID